jgi:DNA-binding beta-propeller fold protein YncE
LDAIVYVADSCGKRVIEFAPGSTKRLRVLRPGGFPNAMPDSYSSSVKRYAPRATQGTDVIPRNIVYFIGGIAIDAEGALLVVNNGRGVVDVFTVENQPPTHVIKTGQSYPHSLAFDPLENRLYVSSFYFSDLRRLGGSGPKRPNTVVELAYPTGERLWTLRESNWGPTGLAVFPEAPFGHHSDGRTSHGLSHRIRYGKFSRVA